MKNSLFGVLDVVFSAIIWLVSTSQGIATLVTSLIAFMLVHYVVKERCGICRRRKWRRKMSTDRLASNEELRCCKSCRDLVGPEAIRLADRLYQGLPRWKWNRPQETRFVLAPEASSGELDEMKRRLTVGMINSSHFKPKALEEVSIHDSGFRKPRHVAH